MVHAAGPSGARAIVRLPAPGADAGVNQAQLLQQLRTAQKFLSEEKDERAREKSQYQARIALLQRAAQTPVRQPSQAPKPVVYETQSSPPRNSGAWVFAGIALLLTTAVLIWMFRPPDPAIPVAKVPVTPSAVRHDSSNNETEALGHFEDSVSDVPRAGVPGLLYEVNRRLTNAGAHPCVERSEDGGFSLVLGKNDQKPLLKALSRCSEAVEKITK